jgi:hypothetical protein
MAAKTASDTRQAVHFAGPPHRLQLLSAPAIDLADVHLEASPDLASAARVERTPPRLRRRRAASGRPPLRIRIDRATPPGDYDAVVLAGGIRYPARITVEAAPRLHATPASLRFDGAPGDGAVTRLMLANTGNVAIDIPKLTSVGVYDDDGVEQAFAQTYRLETDDPTALVGHLIHKLREGHGGLMKIEIDGAGPLEAGTSRQLSLRAELAPKLRPGHSYHGVWSLDPLQVAVAVTVRREARGDRK